MLVSITLYLVAAAIFTEALTEIIVKSALFEGLREWLFRTRGNYVRKLFSCGYCFSVWAAFLPSGLFLFLYDLNHSSRYVIPLFLWLVIHRMSNYFHNINDNYFDKYYRTKN